MSARAAASSRREPPNHRVSVVRSTPAATSSGLAATNAKKARRDDPSAGSDMVAFSAQVHFPEQRDEPPLIPQRSEQKRPLDARDRPGALGVGLLEVVERTAVVAQAGVDVRKMVRRDIPVRGQRLEPRQDGL